MKSHELSGWAPINAYAEALSAEHDAVIIDRSDKDSGLLRSMLAHQQR